MKEIIIDTLLDGLKLLPFLFITFLIIELIEHKFSHKGQKVLTKAKNLGPLLGGILGIFPQCGFSVMATNLYVTRIITIGTLISIYLATSDETLPILISSNADVKIIIKVILIKLIVGIICGFIIDLLLKNKKSRTKNDYHICDDCHCDCKHGVFKSSIKHTINTIIFILIISFGLNVIMTYFGEDIISKVFLKNSIFGPFLGSLVGLIPNCGSSIILTELYLENAISFGTAMAGLLTNSGVALIVLFKSNKNFKGNIKILLTIYGLGVIFGILIELLKI